MHKKPVTIFALGWFTIDSIKQNNFFVKPGKKTQNNNWNSLRPRILASKLHFGNMKDSKDKAAWFWDTLPSFQLQWIYLTVEQSFVPNNGSDKNRYLRRFAL